MRQFRKLLCVFAASSVPLAAASAAEPEKIPPELKAKREGKVSQATPSPLDLIYTPIAPCRAFSQQTIAAGLTKTFQITGSGSFASQNGPATGCGVPAYAKAVSVNLSAAASSAAPAVTLYAAGAPKPGTPNLYAPTSGSYSMSSAIVPVSGSGQVTAHANKAARIYGDVTGYFAPQLWAYVAPEGSLLDSSGRVTSVVRQATGVFAVTFDRNIESCAGLAGSDYTHYGMSVGTVGNVATVYIRNGFGTSAPFIDYWFNLNVKC